MRVLVTGHNGYIGSVMTGVLRREGFEVVGLDNYLFDRCTFGPDVPDIPHMNKDVRDVVAEDLEGFDAVCHLAGISNDPVGDMDPEVTYEINHRASVRLARLAKQAGVSRFIFSSSCSIYGASPGGVVDESSPMNPVTPYGWSKIKVEDDLHAMADDEFSPVFLRNATAYGVSPRLRADLVINNLVGYAVLENKVFMKSDGTPWRPLIHIEDISRAFAAALSAPRERVHDEVLNVAVPGENYQIKELAAMVEEVVPGATIQLADSAGPDIRDYRVEAEKIREILPEFQPIWNVRDGIAELYQAFTQFGTSSDEFLGKLLRIKWLKAGQERGQITRDLRVSS
jgi:nucleoside-diphosphate-sugar epimerase